jgi:8-oxo-dGTP diphosphatase
MYLFTADGFEGELKDCDEGELQWVSRDFLDALPKWEGDKIFLDLLWQDAPFFLLTLQYRGDRLIKAILNGEPLSLPV